MKNEEIIRIQTKIIEQYELLEHVRFYELKTYKKMFKILSIKNTIDDLKFSLKRGQKLISQIS